MTAIFILVKILSVIMELFIVDFVFRTLSKNRLNKIKRALVYISFIVVRSTILCLVNYPLVNLIISLLSCVFIALFYEIKWIKKIFISIIMTISFVLTEMLVGLIISSITSATIEETQTNVIFFIESALCSKIIVLIFAQAVKMIIRKESSKLSVGMYFSLIILPIATCIIVFATSEVIFRNKDLYLTILMIIGVVSILITNYILMFVAERNVKQIVDESTNKMLNQQLVQQKRYYEELISKYKFDNKKMHDIDKQLLVLNSMVEKDSLINAEKELEKINKIVSDARNIGFTGIASIDAILNNVVEKTNAHNINFEKHIFIDEIVSNIEMDFCLLLGNLLDNAVEECLRLAQDRKDDLYVLCDIKKVDDYLNIIVENSCREKENFITSKTNKYKHGYGLQIIDEIVQKFNGSIKREMKDGKFTTLILLKINE